MNEICTQSDHRLAAVPPAFDHAAGPGRGRDTTRLPGSLRQLGRAARRRLLEPLLEAWGERRRRRRERRELLGLDEHMLHDVGITRVDIERLTGVDPWQQEEHVYGASSRWLDNIHLHR